MPIHATNPLKQNKCYVAEHDICNNLPNQILFIDLYLEDQLTAHQVPNQMKENLITILGEVLSSIRSDYINLPSFVHEMGNLYTQPPNLKQFRT